MSTLSKSHSELNSEGIGKCSVPMWCMGMPAGFCDKDAYGVRPPCDGWTNVYTGDWHRSDGKYSGYVPALACPIHGGPSIRTFMDGDSWCAVHPDFINSQESQVGFGKTKEEAIKDLQSKGKPQ